MGVGGSFQDVIVDTSIFVHQLTHPLRNRVVLFTTLNSFQLFKKKEVLPCHQEGKKGLMSCKNYANGMEDYTLLGVVYEIFFFCVCHHLLQQVPRRSTRPSYGWANTAASYSWSLSSSSSMLFNAIVVFVAIYKW